MYDGSPSEPSYELGATVIQMNSNNALYNTYAYEVKCRRSDINKVSNYIAKRGKHLNQVFIKHQWKHTNTETYINGIKKQNEFMDNIRTIPIYGITTAAMNVLYQTLTTNKNILDISPTGKTNSHGRWNAYTQLETFETTTKWLQQNLLTIYNRECRDNIDIPDNFKVEVKFNTTINFTSKTPDPLIGDAEKSVNKFSTSSAYTNSWASVVCNSPTTNYSNQTSEATSSLSTTSDISKTLETINQSIKTILQRLSNIETAINNHNKAIEHLQTFEQETAKQMAQTSYIVQKLEAPTNKKQSPNSFDSVQSPEHTSEQQTQYDNPRNQLSNKLSRLEERMNAIPPIRECPYDYMISNKRQDVKQTPTKTKH